MMEFSTEDLPQHQPMNTLDDVKRWIDFVRNEEEKHPYNKCCNQPDGVKYETFWYFGNRCIIGLN